MLRWFGLVVLVGGLMLAACGRQLTGLGAPDSGSIQPGEMLIRFRVAGQLDFTHVTYVIVFNTSGNGMEPYPSTLLSGFSNYSFALVVGGNTNASLPLLFQYYLAPGGLQKIPIVIPPQLINYVPNSGENPSGGGEFTITFARTLLYSVPAQTSAQPIAQPTTLAQHVWSINFITADPNGSPPGIPVDSMGIGGPTDTTFRYQVDTTRAVDNVITKAAGTPTVQNPSAQLQGFEVINSP